MEFTLTEREVLFVAAGVAAGCILAWLILRTKSAAIIERLKLATDERNAIQSELEQTESQLRELETLFAGREAQLTTELKAAGEKLELMESSRTKLVESFQSLSQEALIRNNHSFLEIAKTTFEKLQDGAKGDLEQRKIAIDEIVKPLKESLTRVDSKIEEIEKTRAASSATLAEQIKQLVGSEQSLRDETKRLVQALRTPNVRGRWGEVQLRRVVEIAGMQEHCDFVEQESFTTETGRLRPDLIVQISGQKQIVIDSKVPLMAYLEALEITDDALRIAKLDEHARHVRRHIDQLASKQYWEQFPSAPECVVLFIPGDSLMTAAIEKDPSLIEYSMARKVVMATPMTLIALLRAVAVGWRQEQLAKNAEEISTLGKTVYERIAGTLEHFSGIGKNLSRAVKSYNDAVGTMQSRLIPAAKRFNELGVQPGREMPELEVIDIAARDVPAINAPELSPAALVEPIDG